MLPVPCRVTQYDCTAVETSRESVPAAGLLFCSAKKVTKKGGPDDRALLTQGARVGSAPSGARLNSLRFAPLKQTPHLVRFRHRRHGAINGEFKSNGNGYFKSNGNFNCRCA